MRTLTEKPETPGLGPQPWAWGNAPRVLVEHADASEGLRIATALRHAGFAVAICPGPAEGARCPLVAGEGCAAAHGADVIVSSLPEDREATAEVRPMLRVLCADVPLIDASRLAPEHVVAAVTDAVTKRPEAPRRVGGAVGPRWNPFRTEREAFRFVLLTLTAFAAVAVAVALGGAWVGVGAWLLVTLSAAFFYLRHARRGGVLRSAPDRSGAMVEYRIVVAVHAEPDAAALAEEIRRRAAGRRTSIRVVSLPHVSNLRRWTSDLDRPTGNAARLLERTLNGFRDVGLDASGTVGDDDPLQAIEDVLRSFAADELVVVADRHADSSALDAIAGGVRSRFALPTEVVTAYR
ncbi:MAG: hypothetical protein ACXVY3_01505 [Gaiellaceae bacterium]